MHIIHTSINLFSLITFSLSLFRTRFSSDLKAANCLVDDKFRAKVADFGFSVKKKIKKSAGFSTGTPYFMSPELLRNESDNTAESDVYAFGIILYEVFSRKDPYEGEEYEDVIRAVADPEVNKRPPIPSSMPAEVTALLYTPALQADPKSRPSFQEISAFLKRFQADNVDPGQQIKHTRRLSNGDASRRLLDEIFPPHIAQALRDGRKVEPEHFECVTIFFSDVVGYTTLSAEMPPMKVSNMLDRLYTRFDDLSKQRGVHKLETIGDGELENVMKFSFALMFPCFAYFLKFFSVLFSSQYSSNTKHTCRFFSAWMGVTNLFESSPEDHVRRIALFSMDGRLLVLLASMYFFS